MSDDPRRDPSGVDEAEVVTLIRLVNLTPLQMPADVALRIDLALAREAASR